MENSLDRLIQLVQTSSNPIDLIELYFENYKNQYDVLLNEIFSNNKPFQIKKQTLTKIIQNLDVINQFFEDKDVAGDPVAQALSAKIYDIVREFRRNLRNLCLSYDRSSCNL